MLFEGFSIIGRMFDEIRKRLNEDGRSALTKAESPSARRILFAYDDRRTIQGEPTAAEARCVYAW